MMNEYFPRFKRVFTFASFCILCPSGSFTAVKLIIQQNHKLLRGYVPILFVSLCFYNKYVEQIHTFPIQLQVKLLLYCTDMNQTDVIQQTTVFR
jgi:hypothetical protein